MEKAPQFIKEFSKEKSPEERREAAQAIKAKRAVYFAEKRGGEEKLKELQKSTDARSRALAERLTEVKKLENKIDEISSSRLGELLNYFKLKKLLADAIVGQRTYEELRTLQNAETAEQQILSNKLELEEMPPALMEAKAMLDHFYEVQKEKWAESPYTKEDITKYFSEKHLTSLSLEDYILLLKRFPSEMATHVTRQGVRDHTGLGSHRAGLGEYSAGFIKIIEDGRLRSPLGVYLTEGAKEDAVARFLQLDEFADKIEALEFLEKITDPEWQFDAGSYSDSIALHFATEEVADRIYGAEKGNEIFIIYPSAYIASQYYFSGQLTKASGGAWNDQWVWANEERGMDLNAGIIFIPNDAKVDPKTGSRYRLDGKMKPIGVPYKEAEDAITSKQFWESYFAKNPARRPSKIVYYRGGDPTGALRQWRQENGIDKKSPADDIGFPERRADRGSPPALAGMNRFKNIALNVIEKHFAKTKT